VIRPATEADVGAIAALERTLFGADAWTREQITQELAGAGREVLVATGSADDPPEGLTGYVATMLIADVIDLQRIAVRPELQRRGLASALVAEALKRPAERMLLEVAETNEAARAFYATVGFVEIGRRRHYYSDGSDALVLERTSPDTKVCTTE